MNRYTKVRELVKDPSLTIKDIAQQTGYDKGHVSRLRKEATKKEWVSLTDEEVSEIIDREIGFNSCWGPEEAFARAVEQALKEKNT